MQGQSSALAIAARSENSPAVIKIAGKTENWKGVPVS